MSDFRQFFERLQYLILIDCQSVKNQASHISVSFALGERVKTEKKIELAEKLLEKLDFKNVPYLVVEHYDKEYEHFHIIAGRIRDDGTQSKNGKLPNAQLRRQKSLKNHSDYSERNTRNQTTAG